MEYDQLFINNTTYTRDIFNWNTDWIIELAGYKGKMKHLLSFGNIILELDWP